MKIIKIGELKKFPPTETIQDETGFLKEKKEPKIQYRICAQRGDELLVKILGETSLLEYFEVDSKEFTYDNISGFLDSTSGLQINQRNIEKYMMEDYQLLRVKEYPPITDYIDGVVKGDQKQIQEYIDACLAVKAKYPKPE